MLTLIGRDTPHTAAVAWVPPQSTLMVGDTTVEPRATRGDAGVTGVTPQCWSTSLRDTDSASASGASLSLQA